MSTVYLQDLIDKMNLTNLTPEIDIGERKITEPDVNRPALQLTGFFEHFDAQRLEIIGHVEYSYMELMSDERKREIYDSLRRSRHLFFAGQWILTPFLCSMPQNITCLC